MEKMFGIANEARQTFHGKTYTNGFPFSNGIPFTSRLEAVRKQFASVRTTWVIRSKKFASVRTA